MLKQQILRLLKGWKLWLALAIELAIIYIQAMTINHMNSDHTVKNAFLHLTGFDNSGLGSSIYFLVLPLTVALAAGSTFQTDHSKGFLNFNLVRTNQAKYLKTTLFSSWLVGAIVGVLPLIAEGVYFFSTYPVKALPNTLDTQVIDPHGWGFSLFMTHPVAFWLLSMGIIFVFSGIYSQISVVASYFDLHPGVETVIPFAIVFLGLVLGSFTDLNLQLNALLSPNYSNYRATSPYYLLAYLVLFEGLICCLTWRKCHDDLN